MKEDRTRVARGVVLTMLLATACDAREHPPGIEQAPPGTQPVPGAASPGTTPDPGTAPPPLDAPYPGTVEPGPVPLDTVAAPPPAGARP